MKLLSCCDENIASCFIERPFKFVGDATGDERDCGIRSKANAIIVFAEIVVGGAAGVIAGVFTGTAGVVMKG